MNNSISKKDNFLKSIFKKKEIEVIPKIIMLDEHRIKKSRINYNALKVVYRLRNFGYDAYIVGGAVRDYLLGREPKDFDVATNATPKDVKKLFSNARIIGKRFKLVHIIFKDCIIETATFRADINDTKKKPIVRDNIFGTIEDDSIRRDFGINSLYYDPEKEIIIDYVDGYKDIKSRKIRVLKKADYSFKEDPVRMIRAVKYSMLLDCVIDKKTISSIKKNSKELSECSVSRLHEEINKIFKTNKVEKILEGFYQTSLLKYFIPFLDDLFFKKRGNDLFLVLKKLDDILLKKGGVSVELYWAVMLICFFNIEDVGKAKNLVNEDFKIEITKLLNPLRVPNKSIDQIFKMISFFNLLRQNQNNSLVFRIKKNLLLFEVDTLAQVYDDKLVIEMLSNVVKKQVVKKTLPKKRFFTGKKFVVTNRNKNYSSTKSGDDLIVK